MAKTVKTLDDFSGGLNVRSDAKDLEDNQFAEARNISNTALGKLTQSGGLNGSSFFPSVVEVDRIDTGSTTPPPQGYGLLSFNMDLPIMNQVTGSNGAFIDDFSSNNWSDASATGSSTYQSGTDDFDLASGGSHGNVGGIKINKTSLFDDGDDVLVKFKITAQTLFSATETAVIKVYLGTSTATVGSDAMFNTGEVNLDGFVGVESYIQFVGKWGTNGDYIHIWLIKETGSASCTITIDDFSIKKIPTTGSNNIFVSTGTGSVSLISSINDLIYAGNSRNYVKTAALGAATFSENDLDMSYDNGIVKVQNGSEIMHWTQVDRTRAYISNGGTSTVRNIEQVNYSSGSGYSISSTYVMDFPNFRLATAVSKGANTDGELTILTPKFSHETTTYGSDTPSLGVQIEFVGTGTGGSIAIVDGMNKLWYLGASLLFDDEMQEGAITWETVYTDLSDVAAQTKMPKVKLLVHYSPFHGRNMWDPRVTGFRIWMSESSTGGGDPLQLVDCNLVNGTYSIYGTSHLNYTLVNDGARIGHLRPTTTAFIELDVLPAIKFSEKKGYSATEAIYASGKTSTIVGANRFLGNFTQAGVTYEDQIIKSDVSLFDIYPSNNFLEVAPNDGDEIVSLMSFGEELVVFKKRTMYILSGADTADVGEMSLEADYPGLGIQQPSQACETEKGIVWINGAGLYLYDGDVSNLSESQMTENTLRIKSDNTFDSLDESLGIAIGYDIENKKLVYSTGSNNENFMIYDFKTETFQPAFGTYGTASGDRQTNFVPSTSIATNKTYLIYGSQTDGNDDMDFWHYDEGPISSGTGTGTSAKFLYVTKDMSFGNPTTRKKVVGVYVTYKAGATTNVLPAYAVDSARPSNWASGTSLFSVATSLFIDGNKAAALDSDQTFNTTGGAWRTVYLKPSAAINNIYTFQLGMISNGAVPSTSEINDITVVYREKSQK